MSWATVSLAVQCASLGFVLGLVFALATDKRWSAAFVLMVVAWFQLAVIFAFRMAEA